MMNSYNIEENKKMPISMKWLGCGSLRFVQTLAENEREKCRKA